MRSEYDSPQPHSVETTASPAKALTVPWRRCVTLLERGCRRDQLLKLAAEDRLLNCAANDIGKPRNFISREGSFMGINATQLKRSKRSNTYANLRQTLSANGKSHAKPN